MPYPIRFLLFLLGLLLAVPAFAQTALHSTRPVFATASPEYASASGGVTFTTDPVRSADIAVDAGGGMHVAFVSLGPVGQPTSRPTLYGYCPPGNALACADPSGWTLVEVDDGWPHVRLALSPTGQPRLFLYDDRATVEGQNATLYAYAECNAGCTTAAGWRVRTLGASNDSGNVDSDRRPVRRFTLDAQGRPRFVHYFGTRWLSGTEWEQPAYLMACDVNCATTGSWRETRLPDAFLQNEAHDLENAALAIGADGVTRLLFARQFPFDNNPLDLRDALVYAECAAPCTTTAHWSAGLPLLWLGTGPDDRSFSMRVDPAGRVHVAVKPVDEPLHYLWCDTQCSQIDDWFGYPLALSPSDGEHPALALDATQRPRIAYRDAEGGLGYAWCDTGCRTASAAWSRVLAESEDVLMSAVPILLPPGCIDHYWFGGLRPSLALDAQGHPHVAYDADYARRCYHDPQHPEWGTFIERLWWTSRVRFFSQPGAPVATEPVHQPRSAVRLDAPFPNPARSETTLTFSTGRTEAVRFVLHDALGREVRLLHEATYPEGNHTLAVPLAGLAPGRYAVRLRSDSGTATRPLIVVP